MSDELDDLIATEEYLNDNGGTEMDKKTHYTLEILPAVEPDMRHKIEDLLVREGFEIIGSGQSADMSGIDISFEK